MICEDTLARGGYKFFCPACEFELTVDVVRHILSVAMTGEELNALLHPGKSQLQPLEGLVWLTKEPCCVTLDDDPTEWRAKLACGHVVGKWYIYN